MFTTRVLRFIKELLLSFGWVGLSLTFSAVSIAIVISMSLGFYVVFKKGLGIDNAFLGSLSLLLSFAIYLGIAGWVFWRYLRRKFQI